MFEVIDSTGAPVTVRVSFGQCVKAGLAFTIGAGLVVPVILAAAALVGGFGTALLALLRAGR